MTYSTVLAKNEVNKMHIQETIFFAIHNIPNVDKTTLDKFLALVNADMSHAVLNHEQLISKIRLVLKYIPAACPQSLMILADLLELRLPNPKAALNAPDASLVIDRNKMGRVQSNSIFNGVL